MRNAPFKFAPKDWFAFFTEHGWISRDIRYLAEEADRLNRPIQFPLFLKIIVTIQKAFTSKERREGFRKFQGYALLERP
jgi:hypothetical protein